MTIEENYINGRRKVIERKVSEFCYAHGGLPFSFPKDDDSFFSCFTDQEICATCSNCCCAVHPCKYSPYDFIDITDINYMSSILDLGLLCISESIDNGLLLIRPRGYADSDTLVSMFADYKSSFRNPCIMQSQTGCLLSKYHRPTEGLLYIPFSEYDHVVLYTERKIEKDYYPYQDALRSLYHKYRNVNMPIKAPTLNQVRSLTRKISGYKR